jgi:flagellar biosynthesis GTPase FlhF
MEREEKAAGASNNMAAGPFGDPRDRRCHLRYAVDEDSILLLVSHGLSLESHILDLSLEGCRLSTRERYTAGMRTRVEVTFKVNGIAFRFVGVVQWTDRKHLVGIHFVEMISRRREQLAEVICEMEAVAAARAAQEAAEREAAETEDQELAEEQPLPEQQAKTEGKEEAGKQEQEQARELAEREARELADWEARQWAEIQEIAQRAKVAQTEDELTPTGQAPVKRERRAQERHAVDTAARIFLVKVGSRLSGRIVDLSLNGCRICSDERFSVGVYTRVETEFCLEGLPFRLGGVIQAIHDRHNVGIRFLDMSERKREQVEQLIAEIAEIEGERAGPAVTGEGAMEGES